MHIFINLVLLTLSILIDILKDKVAHLLTGFNKCHQISQFPMEAEEENF